MNSVNRTARIAGLLYLMLVPLGVFGIMYVPEMLFVPGDIAASIANIGENEQLFRLSIVAALLTQLVNLFLVLYLFKLLKPVGRTPALLMVIFIILAVPIAMLNELNNGAVLALLDGDEQAAGLAALFLELHEHGIQIASIFWGLWLFPMGLLIFRSRYIPRIIGLLLMIGCFGHLFDSLAFFLLPDLAVTVAEYTFWGEIALPLWLVFKGVDVSEWQKRAHEADDGLTWTMDGGRDLVPAS